MSQYLVVMCPKCGFLQVTTSFTGVKCQREGKRRCHHHYDPRRAFSQGPFDTPREAQAVIMTWKAKKTGNMEGWKRLIDEQTEENPIVGVGYSKPVKEEGRPRSRKSRLLEQLEGFGGGSFTLDDIECGDGEREQFEHMLDMMVDGGLLLRPRPNCYQVLELPGDD